MTNATTNIRTWAFGRHLIDLPSNWFLQHRQLRHVVLRIGYRFQSRRNQGVRMGDLPERFADAVNDRSSQIQNVDHDSGGSMMVAQIKLSRNENVATFLSRSELRNYHTRPRIHLRGRRLCPDQG